MKHSLLLLGVIAALAIGAPAYSQYIYIDVDGNGVCNSSDVLTSSTTAVDVWLDTSRNKDLSAATCVANAATFWIVSYDILIHSAGGSVVYGGWTNNLANDASSPFTVFSAYTVVSPDMGVGFAAPFGTSHAAGLLKLGTLSVTVTGSPVLSFLTDPPVGIPSPVTGFGTDCGDNLNTAQLGLTFLDNCGTSSGTPTQPTTWGRIKNLYR